MVWLLIVYTLGILIAAIAAMVEIESIVGSGPIMSLVGIWIAFLSYRRDRPIGLFYGLAVPTVSVFCFIVINLMEWGPSDAHVPVSAFLVLFAWACIPACSLAIWEVRRQRGLAQRRPVQFSIAFLLGLMFVVALGLGLAQAVGIRGFALVVILTYLATAFCVVYRFYDGRRERRLAEVSSIFAPEGSQRESSVDG